MRLRTGIADPNGKRDSRRDACRTADVVAVFAAAGKQRPDHRPKSMARIVPPIR